MSKKTEQSLQQINQVLEKAFFAPLQVNDWLGFHFNQPFLLGLNQDELVDLFARSALAAQRLQPQADTPPLTCLLHNPTPHRVLAHALVSLKDDRPFLFHRTLASLANMIQDDLDLDDFDSMEDMLELVLQNKLELSASAEQEIKALRKQALALIDTVPAAKVKKYVKQILESDLLAEVKNENQLRLWLSVGSGRELAPAELLPQIMIEVWTAWARAITGVEKNATLLLRALPDLDISEEKLELYLAPNQEDAPTLSATCPYCQGGNVIKVIPGEIEAIHRCPHLVFIGTSDPMHLLRVLLLAQVNIGEDTLQLLDSYYQSAGDLLLFANIVTDFYQMLTNQGRIMESSVSGQPHNLALEYMRAYFSQPASNQKEEHAAN